MVGLQEVRLVAQHLFMGVVEPSREDIHHEDETSNLRGQANDATLPTWEAVPGPNKGAGWVLQSNLGLRTAWVP